MGLALLCPQPQGQKLETLKDVSGPSCALLGLGEHCFLHF